MEKKDFFERFNSLLNNKKDIYDLESPHDAMIVWLGEYYLSLDPNDVKDRIVQDKHAEGVDAILLDNIKKDLYFIQAKTFSNFENTKKNLKENDVKSTLSGIKFLLKGDYKGKITPKLENLIDEYHDLDKTGSYKTKILFLHLRDNPIDKKFVDFFKKDFPKVDIVFFNFEQLLNLFKDSYLESMPDPPKKISLDVLTDCLSKNHPNEALVFTSDGKGIAKIYNDHRERIFQKNVRNFLGMNPRSINKQILETAENDDKSKFFWYFNNGITIIC